MAWFPISHTVPQYENSSGAPYSGAVLKLYASGTSTPINFAIDSAGAIEVGSIALNASGNPAVSGNVVIPYVEQKYKLSLYPTQAAADANTGALWTVDGVPIAGEFGATTQSISTTTALTSADNFNHIEASSTITITMPDIDVVGAGFVCTIRNAGTGAVTLDGDGVETINGASNIILAPGDFAMMQSGSSAWSAGISRAAYGSKGTSIAGAATTIIWASDSEFLHITGNGASISSFGTAARAGETRTLIFDDVNTLVHGANLDVPGSANITTAAGDRVTVRADTTTAAVVIAYIRDTGIPIVVTPVAQGGSGVATFTAYAPIFGGTTATGAVQSGTVGNAGEALVSNGASALPTMKAPINFAYAVSTSTDSTTTAIPFDTSIPQNTEGKEYLTLAFTPRSASSSLLIEVSIPFTATNASTNTFTGALFVDTTADALTAAVSSTEGGNGAASAFNMRHRVASGSTSARTYKFRYGPDAGTAYIMQTSAAASRYGGVAQASITVTEYL